MQINIKPNSFFGKYFYKYYKNSIFTSSDQYWENRYSKGGNSGAGSYSKLAEFKAEIINNFVLKNNVKDVIEFGCGDGNQLSLANYPRYIGLDVSKTALYNCIEKFKEDATKSFYLYNSEAFLDNHNIFKAELTLSLDVIYHLVEDEVYKNYMNHLFNASKKYVIIYASNQNGPLLNHVRERNFTSWVEINCKNWALTEIIKNKFTYNLKDPGNTSPSDFYIYTKN